MAMGLIIYLLFKALIKKKKKNASFLAKKTLFVCLFYFFLFCLAESNEEDNIGTITNKDTELTCKNRNMAMDQTKGTKLNGRHKTNLVIHSEAMDILLTVIGENNRPSSLIDH